MRVMLNGAYTDELSPGSDSGGADFDRISLFGDGVFETMFVRQRRIHLRDYHFERLDAGLRAIKLAISIETLERELDDYLSGLPQGDATYRLKMLVSRGAGTAGYSAQGAVNRRLIFARGLDFVRPAAVSMRECKLRLGSQPQLAKIKHCNRLEQVLAKLEQEASGCDEGLLLNQRGEVIEAVSSNVFILEGGTLVTPALTDCGVEGVMRRFLLREIAARHNCKAVEGSISMQRLLDSDGVLLTNSTSGVRLVNTMQTLQGIKTSFSAHKKLLDIQSAIINSMLGLE